jgi:NADH-quinone oxidoreductase subunit J
MNSILFLHIFFISLIVFSSFFLILSKNPVYSVLFLILIFFSSTSILILFEVDFLGLLLLIIYVGAVAVLFLFIVMMLDVKHLNLNISDFLFILISFFFSPIFIYFIYNSTYLSFLNKSINTNHSSFLSCIDSFSNINVFGQYFYNYLLIVFLLAGFILLLALIGSIILTLKYNLKKKNEFVTKKLSRTDTFLSFFN